MLLNILSTIPHFTLDAGLQGTRLHPPTSYQQTIPYVTRSNVEEGTTDAYPKNMAARASLVLVGCGGSGSNSASAPSYDASEAMPAAEMPQMVFSGQSAGDMRFAPDTMPNDGSGAIAAAATERLIIKNGDLALRVEDVPAATAAVSTLASEAGGFVVSSSNSGWSRISAPTSPSVCPPNALRQP